MNLLEMRWKHQLLHNSYKFVKADICDQGKVFKALEEFQADAVVNFAAESHVDRSIDGPEPFVETNVVGTLRLLEAFKAYYNSQSEDRKSSLRFLHVSTDEVYGSLTKADPAFCETTPYAPNSPYSASKASADHLVRSYFHTFGLPTLTTNCSNNYGPYQFPEKFIPVIICNALLGKKIPIYGDGKYVRDWIHVQDNVEAIFELINKKKYGGQYNIGAQQKKNNLWIVNKILKILENLTRVKYDHLVKHVKDRPGHDRRYSVNTSRIEKEIGWSTKIKIEDGLKSTVEWYYYNQKWWKMLRGLK